jgi:long-chain acyl-CoA synthetase
MTSPASAAGARDTLHDLIAGLAARADAPAIVAFGRSEAETWSFRRLSSDVARLAAGLANHGVQPGEPVGLWAPNSPRWIAMYLAAIQTGAMAMPLDERSDAADIARLLSKNRCRWLVTTTERATRMAAQPANPPSSLILLDSEGQADPHALDWDSLLAASPAPPFPARPDDVAVIAHTSGTTGTPKAVPLTHANLMSNVTALLAEDLVRDGDRALLPLPFHHVYPMTVGLLTPLAAGVAIVLPAGLSGPELTAALRTGGVTHLLGVPRLYTALLDGIRAQVRAQGGLFAKLFPRLLALSAWSAKSANLRIGRWLFAPLHRRLGPRLRILVSGGAALDPETEDALTGLGWEVLTGYGLTETSPILAFTRRGRKPGGSAGRPLPGVEMRIVNAGADGIGEIQARGTSVFAGYRNDPAATATVFTEDGWFRTGDLGWLDSGGNLHIAARLTETIVLADGKKIFPEPAETVYADSPFIRELAILGHKGQLVALVVPNLDAIRARGAARAEDLIREALSERGRSLPPHQRLSGIAISHEPLPRTHLGKPRRFLLPALYERALQRGGAEAPAAMSEELKALLDNPAAARVWQWLAARFPGRPLSLDTSPQLDLGIDSLGWVNLSLDLEHALALTLSETAIARIVTLRDLLREAVVASEQPAAARPAAPIPMEQLDPSQAGPALRAARRTLAWLNRLVIRHAFGLRVTGLEHLPPRSPYVICANHASYLDPPALGAALPYDRLRDVWWAGWTGILFAGRLQRAFSRVAQVIPVDPDRAVAASLAWAGAVLGQGRSLVWFPEGARSSDGTLQRFLPGVGVVLGEHPVPVVPAYIDGTFAAWPRGRKLPRRGRITVTFGQAVPAAELSRNGNARPDEVATQIQALVADLAPRHGML